MRNFILIIGLLLHVSSCIHHETIEEKIRKQAEREITQMKEAFSNDSILLENKISAILSAYNNPIEQQELVDEFNYYYAGYLGNLTLRYTPSQDDCNIRKYKILSNMHNDFAIALEERGREVADSIKNESCTN